MSMSELGATLQRHREELGLSLEEIEAVTRIRVRYLEAIEAGNWDALPPGVYTRGLLKMYGRAVGMRPNSVMRMYLTERPTEARQPEPQLISRPLVTEPRVSFETIYSAVVLLLAAGLFGWMIVTQLWPRIEASRQPGPEATATAAAVAIAVGQPSPTGGTPVATVRADTRPTRPPMPVSTTRALTSPTPKATATPASGLWLDVAADADDIWIIVRADGDEVFNNFVRAGESMTFQAGDRLYLKSGLTRATKVSINGTAIDELPAAGAVSELEWTRGEDGSIVQTNLREGNAASGSG